MKRTQTGSLDLCHVVRQSDEQVHADVEGGVVLMSIENGNYYSLNSVGSCIWRLLDSPCRVADLCARLEDRFDVEAERCREEVLNYLATLISENLIEVVDAEVA
jgi:hypothetical protein